MARMKAAMVKGLNAQIQREFAASQAYLAMAVYLDGRNLEHLSAFYVRQSDEERAHAMKFVKYLMDAGQTPVIPQLARPKAKFSSLADVAKTSLRAERAVTDAIHKLVDAAQADKDHATFHFLQWFVEEQVEEENSFEQLLAVIEMSQTALQVESYIRHLSAQG